MRVPMHADEIRIHQVRGGYALPREPHAHVRFPGMPESVRTISFWRGVLPHWEIVDGRYFVTLRLANSLPRGVAEDLATILTSDGEPLMMRLTATRTAVVT